MKKYIFKLLIALLGFSLSSCTVAQNAQEQFEKSFNAFKDAKTLIIEGQFDGYGKKKGKVANADGRINLFK